MRKWNIFANVLICISLGIWAMRTVLSYRNYLQHLELFAAEGWAWYTDVFAWGKYLLPVIALCLVVKLICYLHRS